MDSEIKEAFRSLKNADDLQAAFGEDLAFGTAGLRGIMGAGTARMNIYTIRRATMAYAKYLLSNFSKDQLQTKGVVIGHDNRKWSALFTYTAAAVLAHFQIKVFLFPDNEVTPTPVVSFATRQGGFIGGIVITASHNPKEYNGYKIYDAQGCQLLPAATDQIKAFYDVIQEEVFASQFACQSDLIVDLDESLKQDYWHFLKTMQSDPQAKKTIKIVFSNLNGAARNWTPKLLKELGYSVFVVPEQYEYDSDFTTCPYPNPEILSNYDLAIQYGQKHDADLIILNDPDADRIGIGVKTSDGKYKLLTGNETAPILLDYWLNQKSAHSKMPTNPVMINTFVSSDLPDSIAAHYNVANVKTLTGFKWIGAAIHDLQQKQKSFVFGFEEAYGYILDAATRDKDGIQTSVVVAEACNYYAARHQTLVDVLHQLYQKYGYYYCFTYTHNYEGLDGHDKINRIIANLRSNPPQTVIGTKCHKVEDYLEGLYGMPSQDLLKFYFTGGSWFAVRASGTEPKIKFYYVCVSKTSVADARQQQANMQAEINKTYLL